MSKVLLFDFDGTIADSFDIFLEITDKLATKYHFPKLTNEEIKQLRAEDARSLVKRLKIPFYLIPLLAREMKRMQKEQIQNIKPIKGVSDVLHKLHDQGYKLGILTSNGKENVQNFLSNNDLNLFDYIQSDVSVFGKDKAISKFLNKNHIQKDQIVYIGDEIRDITACKKIGIKIISVSWGFNSREGLQKHTPDYLIDKPSKMLNHILYSYSV